MKVVGNLKSAPCYGLGRIGNRVKVPGGCAAVTSDERSIFATVRISSDGKAELVG